MRLMINDLYMYIGGERVCVCVCARNYVRSFVFSSSIRKANNVDDDVQWFEVATGSFVLSFVFVPNLFIHLSICETEKFSILFAAHRAHHCRCECFYSPNFSLVDLESASLSPPTATWSEWCEREKTCFHFSHTPHGYRCRQIKRISFVFIIS